MSRIRIDHGTASVEVESTADTLQDAARSVSARYRPVDVLDAACAALLAMNTPDAVRLAQEVYRLTAVNLGPRRTIDPEGA